METGSGQVNSVLGSKKIKRGKAPQWTIFRLKRGLGQSGPTLRGQAGKNHKRPYWDSKRRLLHCPVREKELKQTPLYHRKAEREDQLKQRELEGVGETTKRTPKPSKTNTTETSPEST